MVSYAAIVVSAYLIASTASLLQAAQQLVSFNKPAKSDYGSITNYIANVQPLVSEECDWVKQRDDLITLRPGREHAWLDAGLEHLLKWAHCKLRAKVLVEVVPLLQLLRD